VGAAAALSDLVLDDARGVQTALDPELSIA